MNIAKKLDIETLEAALGALQYRYTGEEMTRYESAQTEGYNRAIGEVRQLFDAAPDLFAYIRSLEAELKKCDEQWQYAVSQNLILEARLAVLARRCGELEQAAEAVVEEWDNPESRIPGTLTATIVALRGALETQLETRQHHCQSSDVPCNDLNCPRTALEKSK